MIFAPLVLLSKLHENVRVALVHHRASQLVNEPVPIGIAGAQPCVALQCKEQLGQPLDGQLRLAPKLGQLLHGATVRTLYS